MGKFILLVVLLLPACGGEEEKVCLGPFGVFKGTPLMSANNCVGMPTTLKEATLIIEEDSELRECGWHHKSTDKDLIDPMTLCDAVMKKDLLTKSKGYRGTLLVDLDCSNSPIFTGKCMSFWEIEFEKVKESENAGSQ